MFKENFTQSAFSSIDLEVPNWPKTCEYAQNWYKNSIDSQWWTIDQYREYQLSYIRPLLIHAVKTVPLYQEKYKQLDITKNYSWNDFNNLPILSKSELQEEPEKNISKQIPKEHGRVNEVRTSGSTGQPLAVKKTRLANMLQAVFAMREHIWHQRDFSKHWSLVIFVPPGKPTVGKSWGTSIDMFCESAETQILDMSKTLSEQAQWLAKANNEYLMMLPTNIQALAEYCLEYKIRIPKLEQISLAGEPISAELRSLCKQIWNVPVKAMYGLMESGVIGLQCPEYEHYHIQEEHVYVEILNEQGEVCQPGEIGRIYVTPLYNYASPLIRYDTGDYAMVGEPCGCGRHSRVIKQIMGRSRNMAYSPNGEKFFPMLGFINAVKIADIKQFQLIQKTYNLIEARLVVGSSLTADQEKQLSDFWREVIGYDYDYKFSYVESIPRAQNGKFEEFICEINQ